MKSNLNGSRWLGLAIAVLCLSPSCRRHGHDGPISLSATALSFSSTEGGTDPADQTLTLANTGGPGSVLTWTASSSEPWLHVTPSSGSTSTSDVTTLTIHVSAAYQLESWVGTTSTATAPSAREDHDAAWTGSRMVLWGGEVGGTLLDTGGLYDPGSDTWTGATSTIGAPSVRTLHTLIWTGTEVVVWGGSTGSQPAPGSTYYNEGHRYDPVSDSWPGTISTAGAPTPRSLHTAVWTGSRMIIWGGYDGAGRVNTGGIYNPSTDSWVGTTSTVGAPSARLHHVAVWTGTEMIIWGGQDGTLANLNDGARYDPASDTWTPMPSFGAPTGRQASTAVWTGWEMIVWGGADNSGSVNSGGRYNPATDSWVASTTTVGAPTARQSHGGIWTGTRMIVTHGGISGNGQLNTGGIYQPPIPAIGPHRATITISAPGAKNSPQTITVDLTVSP